MNENECAIRCASWNVAAVNNNPFEYWVSFPDHRYDDLMRLVQDFICDKSHDVPVSEIFTEQMFTELLFELEAIDLDSLDVLQNYWTDDYCKRPAIAGFLKDKALGTKRLTSMPDRITNTINLFDGTIVTRPSAISSYQGPSIGSIETWWPRWKNFMFHREVTIFGKGDKAKSQLVCNLLSPILRSKYPAITVEEQEISVQLQILCLAILDAIFIYILGSAKTTSWEDVKKTLCDSLIFNKATKTCQIISSAYSNVDAFFIQEAAAVFVQRARENNELSEKFIIARPTNIDGKRNQNSLILLDKHFFRANSVQDITGDVVDSLDGIFITAGDLLAVSARDSMGRGWLLASFHGDSNGLSTQPVLKAISEVAKTHFPDYRLLCGLDANTHSLPPDNSYHSVDSFCPFLGESGLVSIWGSPPDPSVRTAFSCRTYLQTQLNKAVPMADRLSARHQNLKDWIVARTDQIFNIDDVGRDNTGNRCFAASTVLPSVEFPSDHTIIFAVMRFRPLRVSPVPSSVGMTDTVVAESECSEISIAMGTNMKGLQSPSFVRLPRIVRRTNSSRLQRTLYDYWGISEKPLATIKQPVPVNLGYSESASTLVPSALLPLDPLHPPRVETEVKLDDHRERLFRWIATKPVANDLDSRNLLMAASEDRSIWIIFGKRPISMGLCKTWFRTLVFLTGVAFCVSAWLSANTASSQSTICSTGFRFVPLTTRNGSLVEIGEPGVHSVGLLQDGVACMEVLASAGRDSNIVVNFSHSRVIDGFFMVTGSGPLELDPVEYRWEVWRDANGWTPAEFPPWMPKSAVIGMPSARLAARLISIRPPISWVVDETFCVGLLAFSLLMAAVLGPTIKFSIKMMPFCTAYHLFVIIRIWRAAETSAMYSNVDSGIMFWTFFLFEIDLLIFASIIYSQKFQVDLTLVAMICFLPAKILIFMNFMPSSAPWSRLYLLVFSSVIPLLGSILLILLRSLTWHMVFRMLVRSDREAFDGAWKAILSDPSEEQSVKKLKDFCSKLCSGLPENVRQRHPRVPWQNFARSTTSRRTLPCFHRFDVSQGAPIKSLDQLFDQALCANFFLRRKVVEWSKECCGYFRVTDRASASSRDAEAGDGCQYATWSEVHDPHRAGSLHIHWAGLKSAERALEKLLRSYDGDVSKLLDCCRESIYFKKTADLVRCLEGILSDRDVQVVRIKNRMDPHVDVFHNAGFRCVVVNLCIKSPDATNLGADGHICELLLVHTAMASLVDEDEHDHYLILRNCRDAPYIYKSLVQELRRWGSDRQSPTPATSFEGSVDVIVSMNPELTEEPKCHRDPNGHVTRQTAAACLSKQFANVVEECSHTVTRCVRDSLTAVRGQRDSFLGKNQLVVQALKDSGAGSTWDSHPFTAALFTPWTPFLVVIYVLFIVVDLAVTFCMISEDRRVSARHFRFTTLETRDPAATEKLGPGISKLGIFLKRDRPIVFSKSVDRIVIENSTFTISYADPVWMNGWWFETSFGPVKDDPMRFFLESSLDGVVWSKVGSSGAKWTWDGSLWWTDDWFRTSLDRGARASFDTGIPWLWVTTHLSMTVVSFIACMFILYAWVSKRSGKGRVFTSIAFFVGAVIRAAQFGVALSAGQGPMAATAFVQFIVLAITSAVLAFRERWLLTWLVLAGAATLANVGCHHSKLLGDGLAGMNCPFCFVANHGLVAGVAFIVLSIPGHYQYWTDRFSSLAAEKKDRGLYESCWADVVHADEAKGTLKALDRRIRDIVEGSGLLLKPRQRIRPDRPEVVPSGPSVDPASSRTSEQHQPAVLPLTELEGPPVHNLDQLFAQAAVADVLLRDKLPAWGRASRGLARVFAENCTRFVRWGELTGSSGGEWCKQVQFASLKSMQRAMEKVRRHYDCDVSQLLDVCRQAIYFASPEDLLACVDALAADPEVRIQRIVNHFSLGSDGASTLGYRAVVVNLRLDTPYARRLAVDTHICELQLVLTTFAELMASV